jgi:hypothetical protein
MADTFSDDGLQQFHRIIQDAALAAYPNPERVGCPGTPILKEIANAPRPFEHVFYEHVAKCSPCLREMLDFRTEFVRSRKKRKSLAAAAVAAMFIVILGAFAIYFIRSGSSNEANPNVVQNVSQIPTNSISLIPNLLRGRAAGHPNTLTIPSISSPLTLLLNLESDSYPLYDVVIQTEGGKVLRSLAGLKSAPVRTGRAVLVSVSSDVFDRGECTVILRGETGKEKTQIVNLYELVVK